MASAHVEGNVTDQTTIAFPQAPCDPSQEALALHECSKVKNESAGRAFSAKSQNAGGCVGNAGMNGRKMDAGPPHGLSGSVVLLRREDEELPSAVRWEASICECYDVDVAKMVVTDRSTGSTRNIRREKLGSWRYSKRGPSWGVFPGEVSVELERIYLTRIRNSLASASQRIPRAEQRKRIAGTTTEQESLLAGLLPGARDLHEVSLGLVCELELTSATGSISAEACRAMCDLALRIAAARESPADAANAAVLINRPRMRHGPCCAVGDARHAGLLVGRLQLIRAVLASAPNLEMAGEEVFDRKYPTLRVDDIGRKDRIRCLLARGMRLGNKAHVPHSKLLRKLEADGDALWSARYLDAMMAAHHCIPEQTRLRIQSYL